MSGGGSSGSSGNSGGSQGSGRVDYPEYMKSWHDTWLQDIDGLIDYATTEEGSPYTDFEAYDPTDALTELKARFYRYDVAADKLAWDSMLPDMVAVIQELAEESAGNTDTVTMAYNEEMGPVYADRLSKYNAAARDLGYILTSSYAIGAALLQERFAADAARVAKEASMTVYKAKQSLLQVYLQTAMQIALSDIDSHRMATMSLAEINRLSILAEREYTAEELQADKDHTEWTLGLYQHAANMMSSIAGAALPMGGDALKPSTLGAAQMSNIGSTISGGLMGGAGGAMGAAALGLSGPVGWGVAGGAALLGGLGGYFG